MSLPFGFLTPNSSFCILSAPMGSKSFIESFMSKDFYEDLGTISSLLMFATLQVAFAMLSLCYAQCPNYLFHRMFPSPCILLHYIEFDTRTITTLSKLLGVRSFDGSIGHLIHHQVIFLISSPPPRYGWIYHLLSRQKIVSHMK
jgi:hypothetical protein